MHRVLRCSHVSTVYVERAEGARLGTEGSPAGTRRGERGAIAGALFLRVLNPRNGACPRSLIRTPCRQAAWVATHMTPIYQTSKWRSSAPTLPCSSMATTRSPARSRSESTRRPICGASTATGGHRTCRGGSRLPTSPCGRQRSSRDPSTLGPWPARLLPVSQFKSRLPVLEPTVAALAGPPADWVHSSPPAPSRFPAPSAAPSTCDRPRPSPRIHRSSPTGQTPSSP